MNEALIRVRKRRSEDHHLSYETNSSEEFNPVEMLRADDTFHPEVLYTRSEKQRALRKAIDSLGSTSRIVVWLWSGRRAPDERGREHLESVTIGCKPGSHVRGSSCGNAFLKESDHLRFISEFPFIHIYE